MGGKSNPLKGLSTRKQYRSTRLDSIFTRSQTNDALERTDMARPVGRVTHQVGHVTCPLTFRGKAECTFPLDFRHSALAPNFRHSPCREGVLVREPEKRTRRRNGKRNREEGRRGRGRARDEIPKLETRNEIDEIRNTKLQGGPTNLQDVVSNFNDIP